MRINITSAMVVETANSITGRSFSLRQFRALFGVSPKITAIAWELMLSCPETVQNEVKLKGLLKALHFLSATVLSRTCAYYSIALRKPSELGTNQH